MVGFSWVVVLGGWLVFMMLCLLLFVWCWGFLVLCFFGVFCEFFWVSFDCFVDFVRFLVCLAFGWFG